METLLKNPKMWVALISLVVTIITAQVPNFNIDQEAVVAQVIILVAYVYGVVQDPGGSKWEDLFKSRKFWAAAIGVVSLWLTAFNITLPYGISYDTVIELVTMVSTTLILAFAHIQTAAPLPASSQK